MPASERHVELPPSSISKSSPIPYYLQLKEVLRGFIESDTWRPGDRIPPELTLCDAFGVSRTVVRQTLNELTHEGLVVREKGRGTFVAAPKIRESLIQRLTGFYQDMAERGNPPVSRVLQRRVLPASQKLASLLEVAPGTPIVEIERLRFVRQEPIVLVTTYIPQGLCSGLLEADLTRQSLYAFLHRESGLVIARGRRVVEAVSASEYEARLFGIKRGSPLIRLESVSYLEDGTPVEYYLALHRGDRSRFEVELVRVREDRRLEERLILDPATLPNASGTVVEG